MDKKSLLVKLKESEIFTSDERSYLVELLNTKKYGLVWEDKPEDAEDLLRTQLPVLQEVVEKRILASYSVSEKTIPKAVETNLFTEEETQESILNHSSDNELLSEVEAPNHILIEGDNLHALTALTFTHEGKIDVIYIDPPYNTEKKDFRYNDTFVDKEDTFRHSKWLSFMHKRLEIAKRLLKDSGVIFISIDDNESSQLKLLMDQVFSENDQIAQFIHKNNSNKNQAKLVGISTEYMLCYAKSKLSYKGVEWKVSKKGAKDIALVFNKLKKQGLALDEIEKEIKLLYQRPKYSHLSRWNKVNENGVFKDADLSREGGPKNYTIINPNTGNPCKIPERGWGKSYDELLRLQKEKLIWYGEDNTPPGLIDYITSEDLTVPDSLLFFDNSVDTKWQKNVFGKLIFDNPKPLEMIKMTLDIIDKKSGVILDFFAGSGTTLHATIELNADDGGNRQCILVTNNENNICEEVTYERNKRVIEGYTNAKGVKVAGLSKNNLRYYRTEFIPSTKTEQNKRQLTQASTNLLCIKEDCYNELTTEYGYNPLQCRIFTDNAGKFMVVVYHSRAQWQVYQQLIGTIKAFKKRIGKVKLYGFSPEKETLIEDFAEIEDLIEAVPLPEAIYNAYRATFRLLKLDKKSPLK